MRLFNLALLVCLGFLFFNASGQSPQQNNLPQPGVVRIKLKPESASRIITSSLRNGAFGIAAIDQYKSTFGITSIKRVFAPAGKFERAHQRWGLHLWYEVTFDKNVPVNTAIESYRKLSYFEIVEPKSQTYAIEPISSSVKKTATELSLSGPTNDPLFADQWHYKNTGQTGGTSGADISLEQAWSIQTGSDDVIVAVIDGGIDVHHADLTASMWVNTDEIAGNNIDDDNNGYVDDVHGYGFGDQVGEFFPHPHGTHVGGTIAAVTNNATGVSGIAGGNGTGNGVKLMSCAGFGEFGTGGFEDAMVYAADNGAVISQNSWGGGSSAIEDAIDYFVARAGYDNSDGHFDDNIQIGPMAGGIVIFAAGNSSTSDPWWGYPASYEPVMAVAATDHNDTRSYFSNFGDWVDIAAPGSDVLSTLPDDTYDWYSGTSMACPHVSGVAALIISEFGGSGFTPDLLWERLQGTADNIDDKNPDYTGMLGAGRVNAHAALQQNDGIAPANITDLVADNADVTSIRLNWTAPGGSGTEGAASAYEIRYSQSPINSSNFGSATLVTSRIKPQVAGSEETFTVEGLAHSTSYYFAIRARDFFGNQSAISNVVTISTLQPPVIAVTPDLLEHTLFSGDTAVRYLTITNTGFSALQVNLRTTFSSLPDSLPEGSNMRKLHLRDEFKAVMNKSARRSQAYTRKSPGRATMARSLKSQSPVHSHSSASNGRLFALDYWENTIVEFEIETGTIINSIPGPEMFGGGPDGLAFDGQYLYYLSAFGSLTLFQLDPQTGEVLGQIDMSSLGSVDALAHSGKYVYALNYYSSTIFEIDFDNAEVIRVIEPEAYLLGGLSFGGNRNTLFASDGYNGVYEIELSTGNTINYFSISSSSFIYGLGYSQALGVLFVSNPDMDNAIAVDPDSGVELYTISNVISWAMAADEAGNNWLRPDVNSATIEPGESQQFAVTLSASGLVGGIYNGAIIVSSNDPVTPEVEVPVTLTVFGAPNIVVDTLAIDFGEQFVDKEVTSFIEITNTGTDVLKIQSVQVAGDGFATDSGPLQVEPNETSQIKIKFKALAVAQYNGTVTLTTNDTSDEEIVIDLKGEGVPAPDINVYPGSISDTLLVGMQAHKTLTISNTGGGNLQWEISIQDHGSLEITNRPGGRSVTGDRIISNNSGQQLKAMSFETSEVSDTIVLLQSSPVALTCIAADPTTGKIYGQQNGGASFYRYDPQTNMWSTLTQSPVWNSNNGGAVFLNGEIYTSHTTDYWLGIYTIATDSWTYVDHPLPTGNIATDGTYLYFVQGYSLLRYDPDDNEWSSLPSSPIYFNRWGGLQYHNGFLYGHMGDGYSEFAKFDIVNNTWTSLPNLPDGAVLGSAIDPVAGIYYAYGSYWGYNLYSYDIASSTWHVSGLPFPINDGGMAYVGAAGKSGVYFVQGEIGTSFAKTNAGSSWLSTDIREGVIEPGEETTVDITLDATDLYGGTYNGQVIVSSDDPNEPAVTVPVSLLVIGSPNIEVEETFMDLGLIPSNSYIEKYIKISNTGTDDLNITQMIAGAKIHLPDSSAFVLKPGMIKSVPFMVNTSEIGSFSSTITLYSNDTDESLVEVQVLFQIIESPIVINPAFVKTTLGRESYKTTKLAIQNTSDEALEYYASVLPADESSVDPSSWLYLDNNWGYLQPGQADTVTLYMYSYDLEAGSYPANVSFWVSHSSGVTVDVPIEVTVEDRPIIEVVSDQVRFDDTFIGQFQYAYVEIYNTGSETLYLDSLILDAPFQLSSAVSEIEPNGYNYLILYFPADALGWHTGELKIHSNDPETPIYTVALSAFVKEIPKLTVTVEGTDIEVVKNGRRIIPMFLQNGGEQTLFWSVTGLTDWAFVDVAADSLLAGNTQELVMTIDAQGLENGSYVMNLVFAYHHPYGDLINVPFTITVFENRPPQVIAEITRLEIPLTDETFHVNLAQHFQDPDGDALKFQLTSQSTTAIGAFTLLGSVLSFKPLKVGTDTVSVVATDPSGAQASMTFEMEVTPLTGLDDPNISGLSVYPNPIATVTTFEYFVHHQGHVKLEVTDVTGRVISNLVDEIQSPGKKQAVLNGGKLTAGYYLFHLTLDGKGKANGKLVKN